MSALMQSSSDFLEAADQVMQHDPESVKKTTQTYTEHLNQLSGPFSAVACAEKNVMAKLPIRYQRRALGVVRSPSWDGLQHDSRQQIAILDQELEIPPVH